MSQLPALRHLLASASVAVVLAAASSAHAGIASTSGSISVISHPTGTLNSNDLESDTVVYAWFEQRVVNPGAQNLEHVGAGLVNSGGSANPLTITPAFAESYIVHYDQAGGGSASVQNVSITFDHEIIGVFHSNGGLAGSDATFTPAGLTYGALTARQYELGGGGNNERYSISADLRTITILNTYTVNDGVDQIRILVNPEPGTFALMALGVLGLGTLVRRRRRRPSSAQ